MYNYISGTPNFNGSVKAGRQDLTIGLEYYKLSTSVNILPQAVGAFADPLFTLAVAPSVAAFNANSASFVPGTIPNDFSQDALNRLVEIISQRGQPVIMGTPTGPVLGVYTVSFANEHPSAWGVTATTAPVAVPVLVAAVQTGGKDFGFDVDASLAVTVSNSL